MKILPRIIFWLSIVLIACWLFMPLASLFVHLKFIDHNIEDLYEESRFWGMPLAILLTLFGTIKPGESGEKKRSKVIATMIVAFVTGLVLFFSIFFGMCAWTDERVLFVNKESSSKKIVLRGYGCGPTNSGPPIYGVFQETEFLGCLLYVTRCDTLKIDRNSWTPIAEPH